MSKPKVSFANPYFYIPNFLMIRNKNSELVKLKPNKPQKKLLDTIIKLRSENKPVRIIILKARQMGFSTITEADCTHQTCTHKYFNSTIIAHEDQASQNLYNMFKTYYENLPNQIRPMRKRNNSRELLFENPTMDDLEKSRNPGLKSSVKVATAKNTATGRSQTINYLHASEVAFWDNPEETFTGLLQCVPRTSTSTVIMESTANGVGDYFYNTWQRAEKHENDFVPLFFAWFEMDEYQIPFDTPEEKNKFISEVEYTYKDSEGNIVYTEEKELMMNYPEVTYEKLKWRKWCLSNNCHGDIDKFHQEYPSNAEEAFIASGRPRFNMNILRQYLKQCTAGITGNLEQSGDNIVFVPEKSGVLTIYKMPEEDKYYSIGADVAEGLINGDYSVGLVGDTDFDLCAKYRTHIDPDLFGKELVKLAKFYNGAYLGVENNNHGHACIRAIQDMEYWNMYFTKNFDKINDTVMQKIGWSTTAKTKPMMIDKLAEFLRNKWFGIKDKDIIQELITYVIDEKGITNAQEGCHDDCVMSLGILLQVLLEGKSDSFVPYKPDSDASKKVEKNFNGIKRKFSKDKDMDDEENSLEIAD